MEAETLNPSSSSPPPPEPAQKKLKLSTDTISIDPTITSTTTTTTTAEAVAVDNKKPNYKRRKVAIFFAYCGVGYQGMQKNPGAKTIEGDLEEALHLAGAVPDQDAGQPRRWDWARSARTDKGVSAVGQVSSGWFYVDPPGFVDRLNSHLPDQIRIFGYKRVTPTFNAKKLCDRRRYVYLIPVFALDPSRHQDRVLGYGDAAAECLECSERGGRVAGDSESVVQSGISSNGEDALVGGGNVKLQEPSSIGGEGKWGNAELEGDTSDDLVDSESVVLLGISSTREAAMVEGENVASLKEEEGLSVGSEMGEDKGTSDCLVKSQEPSSIGNAEVMGVKKSEFSYGEKEKERFNRILKHYEGTHNFHNFTTRTKAEDPSARRYIVSFSANTIVTIQGIEFVKCEVVGQSFMLHQIRKMIGLAVAIMRNCADESIFDRAFQQDVRINVPMAPEVGLYLDECLFTSYNKRWKKSHEEVSMKSYSEEAEEFKMKYIYSHIATNEHKEGVVGRWLHYLNLQNYPDLGPPQTGSVAGSVAAEADNAEAAGDNESNHHLSPVDNAEMG